MEVQICDIRITDRIRKDNGDIQSLAESIQKYGLLQAIVVMDCNNGYVLIAGYRRLSAMKFLGRQSIAASVLSPMDAKDQLLHEIEENESRKEFTPSERIEYTEIQDMDCGPYPDVETNKDTVQDSCPSRVLNSCWVPLPASSATSITS